ncbi:tRNA(Ile)-lysidine synthase [Vibrio chagasii]|nr:tRNA(Ile)-lysidine synthase [Vibrio chagasii]
MNVYNSVKASLEKNLPESKHFVVALSGGCDSVVLLHAVSQYVNENREYTHSAIHVNHSISKNALNWEEHCAQLAKSSNCADFQAVRVDLSGVTSNIEAVAREARYKALSARTKSGDLLITGQHQDDQCESLFLALKRGSGTKGLGGIHECRKINHYTLARPLLNTSRAEIVEYALKHNLEWVEDESNKDDKYDRNFLRNSIIPHLEDRWNGFSKSVARTASICRDQEDLLNELLQPIYQSVSENKAYLAHCPKVSEKANIQLLRMWLNDKGILMPSKLTATSVINEVTQGKPDSQAQFYLDNSRALRVFKQRIYLENLQEEVLSNITELHVNTSTQFTTTRFVSLQPSTSGNLRLPKDNETVSVRFGYEGVRLNLGHRAVKVKKVLLESDVPSWERNLTPLIYYNENLAAVGNVAVDEGFHGNELMVVLSQK